MPKRYRSASHEAIIRRDGIQSNSIRTAWDSFKNQWKNSHWDSSVLQIFIEEILKIYRISSDQRNAAIFLLMQMGDSLQKSDWFPIHLEMQKISQ